jgi:hypothetical protein
MPEPAPLPTRSVGPSADQHRASPLRLQRPRALSPLAGAGAAPLARSPSPCRARTAACPPPTLHPATSPRSHAYASRAPSPPPPLAAPPAAAAAAAAAAPPPASARALCALRLVTIALPSPEAAALAWALPPLASEAAFHAATAARLAALAAALAALRPDILCLQGASTFLHPALGHCTLAHYFARALRLAPAGASYGSRAVAWAYPAPPPPALAPQAPQQQQRLLSCMGVATLYNAATVRHVAQVSHAAAHGESALQRGATGSAFTLDCFARAGAAPPPAGAQLHVLNTALLPAALPTAPLGEVLARAGAALRGPLQSPLQQQRPWQRCVLAGSLGARAPPAARALASLLALQPELVDLVLPEELGGCGAPGSASARSSAAASGAGPGGGAADGGAALGGTSAAAARTAAALTAATASPAFLSPPLRDEHIVLGPGLGCGALALLPCDALVVDLEL